VKPWNDARECYFKSDNSLYNCRPYTTKFVNCQKDPEDYIDFLSASTLKDRQPVRFDFFKNTGYYDKFL
jgi:hypothetical protein